MEQGAYALCILKEMASQHKSYSKGWVPENPGRGEVPHKKNFGFLMVNHYAVWPASKGCPARQGQE
jgi:hypothetical protein